MTNHSDDEHERGGVRKKIPTNTKNMTDQDTGGTSAGGSDRQPGEIDPEPNNMEQRAPQMEVASRKLPMFWRQYPDLWFVQVEANFARARITKDRTKVVDIMSQLEPEMLLQLREFNRRPEPEQTYQALKELLLKRFAKSDCKRTQDLLENLGLDDRRPSDLLREMRQVAGDDVSAIFLKNMWMQRLPINVQQLLLGQTGDIDTIAEYADRLCEMNPHSVASIDKSGKIPQDRMDRLETQVSRMAKAMEHMMSTTKKRADAQKQKATSSSKDNDMCYFHNRFGDKAHKCREPCAYQQKN